MYRGRNVSAGMYLCDLILTDVAYL